MNNNKKLIILFILGFILFPNNARTMANKSWGKQATLYVVAAGVTGIAIYLYYRRQEQITDATSRNPSPTIKQKLEYQHQEEDPLRAQQDGAAHDFITVYNANVPIESIQIQQTSDGLIRNGLHTSKQRALWHIPVELEQKPFLLSLIANGKKYIWDIPSFDGPMDRGGTDLALIQFNGPNKPKLQLQQINEVDTGYYSRLIPLLSETPDTTRFPWTLTLPWQ